MGGHHHEPFKVPHYSKYNNWQHIPALLEHSRRLERIGLTDPWIRNFVYKYDPKNGFTKSRMKAFYDLMKPGFFPGLAIVSAVVAMEEGYNYYTQGHTSWSGHH